MKESTGDEPKVIKILFEYDDGSVREAEGADAEALNKHWMDMEFFFYTRSCAPEGGYTGPTLK